MKINIKKTTAVIAALMTVVGVAQATLIQDLSGALNTAIPDGNPAGIASSQTVSGSSGAIQDVSVNLKINGGYNADLYGYLVFQPTVGSAATEVLLNQIGVTPSTPFGQSGAGMNVTLSDFGLNGDIHSQTGSTVLTGSYTPDSANTLDSTFTESSANGTWTLFLADLSVGGGTSTLASWEVDISVVPEPVTWALIVFASLILALRVRAAVASKGGATT